MFRNIMFILLLFIIAVLINQYFNSKKKTGIIVAVGIVLGGIAINITSSQIDTLIHALSDKNELIDVILPNGDGEACTPNVTTTLPVCTTLPTTSSSKTTAPIQTTTPKETTTPFASNSMATTTSSKTNENKYENDEVDVYISFYKSLFGYYKDGEYESILKYYDNLNVENARLFNTDTGELYDDACVEMDSDSAYLVFKKVNIGSHELRAAVNGKDVYLTDLPVSNKYGRNSRLGLPLYEDDGFSITILLMNNEGKPLSNLKGSLYVGNDVVSFYTDSEGYIDLEMFICLNTEVEVEIQLPNGKFAHSNIDFKEKDNTQFTLYMS